MREASGDLPDLLGAQGSKARGEPLGISIAFLRADLPGGLENFEAGLIGA